MNTTLLLALLLTSCATPEEKATTALEAYGTDLLRQDYTAVWKDVSKEDRKVWADSELPGELEVAGPKCLSTGPCEVKVSEVVILQNKTLAKGTLSLGQKVSPRFLVLEDGTWKVQAEWAKLKSDREQAAKVYAEGVAGLDTSLQTAEIAFTVATTLDPREPKYEEARKKTHSLNNPPFLGAWIRSVKVEEHKNPDGRVLRVKYSLRAKSIQWADQELDLDTTEPELVLECFADSDSSSKIMYLDADLLSRNIFGLNVSLDHGKFKPVQVVELPLRDQPRILRLAFHFQDTPGLLVSWVGYQEARVMLAIEEASENLILETYDVSTVREVLEDLPKVCTTWDLLNPA